MLLCVIKQQTAWNEWHSGTIYDNPLVFHCRSWGAWHGVWSLGHYVLTKCWNGRLSMVSGSLAFSFLHRSLSTLSRLFIYIYRDLALSCNIELQTQKWVFPRKMNCWLCNIPSFMQKNVFLFLQIKKTFDD